MAKSLNLGFRLQRKQRGVWMFFWAVTWLTVFVAAPASADCTAGRAGYSGVESTPTVDFEIHGDGTVTDHATGLTWDRCPLGMELDDNGTPVYLLDDRCIGTGRLLSWATALGAATAARLGDYKSWDDWRLPNVRELLSLVESCGVEPAINLEVFPNTPSSPFWSSTTVAQAPEEAWTVNYSDGQNRGGEKDLDTARYYVRLVRGGATVAPTGLVVDAFDGLRSPTTTQLQVTPADTSYQGQLVTLQAQVAGTQPTGEVLFLDGDLPLDCLDGSAELDAAGATQCRTAGLTEGVHQLSAIYLGDRVNLPSFSAVSSHEVSGASGLVGGNRCSASDVIVMDPLYAGDGTSNLSSPQAVEGRADATVEVLAGHLLVVHAPVFRIPLNGIFRVAAGAELQVAPTPDACF